MGTFKTAQSKLRKAIISKITELNGNWLGDVKKYPRVEVTDISESPTTDKGNSVRTLSFSVDAISNASYSTAAEIISQIDTSLVAGLEVDNLSVISVSKTFGTEINEVGEADIIIYRLRSTYDIIVEDNNN
jgi:hypothetical protein